MAYNLEDLCFEPWSLLFVWEYLSYAHMIDEVAQLREVKGLMANGRITATPVVDRSALRISPARRVDDAVRRTFPQSRIFGNFSQCSKLTHYSRPAEVASYPERS